MAYVTYQIWLYRSSLVFNTKIMHAHQILERALFLIARYYHFDTASSSVDALAAWDFRVVFAMSWRVLFISWEPHHLGL